MGIINKIENIINEGIFDGSCKIGNKGVTMPVVAKDEKEAKKKFIDKVKLHQKNGHLPKGKIEDVMFEARIIKPVKPKEDDKSWKIITPYDAKKVKQYAKKHRLKIWRILGSYTSRNFNNERQVTVNFETTDMESYAVTINLKTGEVYGDEVYDGA